MIDSKLSRRSRRTAARFPLRYEVIPVDGRGLIDARVEDLSAEGLRFQCGDEVRVRSGLLLELQLPDALPVLCVGRTAWVRELPDNRGFEVGGWFEDQSTGGRKTIELFLQREFVSDGP